MIDKELAVIRNMEFDDIHAALAAIDSHDEDDAEEAAFTFDRRGVSDFRVLEYQRQVVGVTGFRAIEAADRGYWLSWTYVHADFCGHGLGRKLLEQLLDELRAQQARKIFVAVSDYTDPSHGPVYETAHKLYKSLGFVVEVENPGFYAVGENQALLGLRLQEGLPEFDGVAEEHEDIEFFNITQITETSGSYVIEWRVPERKFFRKTRHFSASDLQIGVESASNDKARAVYITFPSNLPRIHEPLAQAGFQRQGQLTDFYEDGVDELHFVYYISQERS